MSTNTRRKKTKNLDFELGKACIAVKWAKNPDWRRILRYLTEDLGVAPYTLISDQKKVKEYLNKETEEYVGSYDFEEYFDKVKSSTHKLAPRPTPPQKTSSAPPASDTWPIALPSTLSYSQSDATQKAVSPTSTSGDLSEAGSQFENSDTSSSKSAPALRDGIENILSNATASSISFHFLLLLLTYLRKPATTPRIGPTLVRHSFLASA